MKLVPRNTGRGVARAATLDVSLRSTVMPWGPFHGRPVCEVPDSYLYQLVERRLWPNIAEAVEAELEFRARERRRAA